MFYILILSALASDPQPAAPVDSQEQHPVETLDQIEDSMDEIRDIQADTLALLTALLEEKKLEDVSIVSPSPAPLGVPREVEERAPAPTE